VSRGPGAVQRAALEFVETSEETVDAFEVAVAVYAVAPAADGRLYLTPSQVTAVRRALAGLVRRGEIRDMGRGEWRFGRRHYASPAAAIRYEERGSRDVRRKKPRYERLIGSCPREAGLEDERAPARWQAQPGLYQREP
jgi:hypothetical protein